MAVNVCSGRGGGTGSVTKWKIRERACVNSVGGNVSAFLPNLVNKIPFL